MPSPNISEMITTTINNRTRKASDCVTKNNALLSRLNERGNVKYASGGTSILQEIEYAEGTTGWYSGYDILSIVPADILTSAEFSWKQAYGSIVISGLEGRIQNAGKERMIELLGARIKNADKSLKNKIALGCWSDGTGDGGKQIGGIQLLITTTPTTGSWGGLNRANWAFARNQAFSGSTDGGAAVSATNIQSYMNQLWLRCVRGADAPDLGIADNNYYNFYWTSLQAIQRIERTDMAEAGFTALKYMNADIVYDGAQGGGCPANRMYFLNTDYLFLRPHSETNFVSLGGERMNSNQDATVRLIGWAGNMTMSGAQFQGVLYA